MCLCMAPDSGVSSTCTQGNHARTKTRVHPSQTIDPKLSEQLIPHLNSIEHCNVLEDLDIFWEDRNSQAEPWPGALIVSRATQNLMSNLKSSPAAFGVRDRPVMPPERSRWTHTSAWTFLHVTCQGPPFMVAPHPVDGGASAGVGHLPSWSLRVCDSGSDAVGPGQTLTQGSQAVTVT
jgi:hypothetical protein